MKALSEAYVKTMRDPKLIAEAKKGRMDMDRQQAKSCKRWRSRLWINLETFGAG